MLPARGAHLGTDGSTTSRGRRVQAASKPQVPRRWPRSHHLKRIKQDVWGGTSVPGPTSPPPAAPNLLDKPGVLVGGPHWRSLCGVQGASSTWPGGHLEMGRWGGLSAGAPSTDPSRTHRLYPAHWGWHFWHISQGWSGEQKVPFLQAHCVFLSARQGLSST